MAQLDENQTPPIRLGDLGGAFSVPTVRIGLRLGLFSTPYTRAGPLLPMNWRNGQGD